MTSLVERLASQRLFSRLDPETLEAIVARGRWYSLAGGWELFAQGGAADEMYFVISGRLIVVRSGPSGDEVVGYVRAGEPVGEMSLLSGEAHSASVFALRDTEIIALSRADVEAMLEEEADLANALALSVLQRARHPRASFQQSAPRVFALISTSPSIDIEARARRLCEEVRRYGVKSVCYVEDELATKIEALDQVESEYDIVLVASRIRDSSWYRFVLRHADRFFVLARRDARPPYPFPLSPDEHSPARRFRLVDLVMLHEGAPQAETRHWAEAIGANRIFHWRDAASVGRIARVIAGKSVGLVLSGGGARAYTHIGAVRALREKGVPLDFVSGASMGAIIAACVAMGWDDDEIDARIRATFVASNPLGDHILPVVSLTGGKRVDTRLEANFGDVRIEDLQTPFFCVSSELVAGEARVHMQGSLREALRASISLPGILPPVVDGAALLVDGAVVNNFPTDIMASVHRGLTIGIDVAREGTIEAADFRDPPGFFSWIREHGFSSAPPIVTLLMRAATARRARVSQANPADIHIAPTIPGVDLRDWKNYEPAVFAGYAAAMEAIEANWDDLRPIAEGAAADAAKTKG